MAMAMGGGPRSTRHLGRSAGCRSVAFTGGGTGGRGWSRPLARTRRVCPRAVIVEDWPHRVEELLAVSNAVCLFAMLGRQSAATGGLGVFWRGLGFGDKEFGGAGGEGWEKEVGSSRGSSRPSTTGEPSVAEQHAASEARAGVVALSGEEVWERLGHNFGGTGRGDLCAGEEALLGKSTGGSGDLPKLVLQCLKPSERKVLLQISYESLKRKLLELKTLEGGKEGESFEEVCSQVLNSCVKDAAERWLGYSLDTKWMEYGREKEVAKSGKPEEQSWTVLNLLQEDKRFLYTSALRYLTDEGNCFDDSSLNMSKGWVSSAGAIMGACSNILEDCIVMIAETIADAYLEEVCQGKASYVSPATAEKEPFAFALDATLVHPVLSSTRKIERFRNQVGLYRLLYKYFFSVQSIYEDKYRLWSVSREAGLIAQKTISLKRAADLRGLTGVRRAYGLLLEASDVVLPIARRLFDFAQEGIQHLLVLVIGRSLGLILRGVRESLKGTAAIGRKAEGTNKDNGSEKGFPLMQEDSFSFSY
ncbi:hypothetical protein A3770_02p12350 [Chloropicon primus]|uniref:Uncharacterized protein n=1 Tax=Chloropicon primus TaxID=1764295 RepID=A0A5B8MEA7_9CHLO|nr:hypothetical protein A3770_02p12350 [Chloropicon primus]|eukprot:QDZ18717.1 hypothetical protein A3770_02p12350 [Chloropicon primus]